MRGALVAANVLAALSLIEALYSLWRGAEFARRFASAARRAGSFAPPATLIVPCRGIDPGLEENLESFFSLDYPDWQLVLVTDDSADPAVPLMRRLCAEHPEVTASVLIAGPACGRGQKVHNLRQALRLVRERDDVVAFGDSDIRPDPAWLRFLVAPLEDATTGVSTGFRWYVPVNGGFASVLRSVWNAGVAGLLHGERSPFAWGGAMGVRRETLRAARIPEYWHGALSDDLAVTRAMQESGLAIRFQPRCLSFSHERCTLRDLLHWSFRQLAITRVYHRSLWRLGFLSEVVNNAAFWGGAALLVLVGISGAWQPAALALAMILVTIYGVRSLKAWMRLRAVLVLFPREAAALAAHRWAYVLWGPITSVVTLVGLIRSLFSTEIEWRGIRYRMVSPNETVIVGREE